MPLNSGEIVYMENDHKIRYSHVNDRFREGNLIFLVLHAPLTRDLQIQRQHPTMDMVQIIMSLCNLSFPRANQNINYLVANGIYGILIVSIQILISLCLCHGLLQQVLIAITFIELPILQMAVMNKTMQCYTSYNDMLLSMSRETQNALQNALLLLQDSKSPLNDIMKR